MSDTNNLSRQNFQVSTEDAIQGQINFELKASYVYMSMAAYFARDSVELPGLAKYFRNQSEEERSHAQKFIDYTNLRGGNVVLKDLSAPEVDWKSAKNAWEFALTLEKENNKSLMNLWKVADQAGDMQLQDYLESEFLQEQVESIRFFAGQLVMLNRAGTDGLGLYLWDQNLLEMVEEGKAN
eukprot:TRINITY_DN42008_c0_g1_i1.p1 TRINITY_DN42008_c0_g1~~TRINITY_DN42008_c0_g1_i1.p1  ORF type:complete len:182 (-),score=21.13 TRINITY_DN42008_c0_g1_i1:65-610(-)